MSNRNPYCGVQCPKCKKRMFSSHRHNFWSCGCPNETTVDGGMDYLRYGWVGKKPKVIVWDDEIDGNLPTAKDSYGSWPY